MTKPWVMDRNDRTSQRYRATHEELSWEIRMDRLAEKQARARRMAKYASSVQLPLFDPVVQPRNAKPEPLALFDAVVMLRKHGRAVYRAGRHEHIVDGHTVGDAQLAALARQIAGPA